MAKKPQSFKVDNDKKIIVVYDNVEQTNGEKALVELYLKQGYLPKIEEKKKGKTVAEMLEELKANEEVLAQFEKAYAEKGGFHKACKIYAEWKKEASKKTKAKAEKKTTDSK
jgi:hypothetical protein